MKSVNVRFAAEFRGDDVVLLAMDTAGSESFGAALKRAVDVGSSQLERCGICHYFSVVRGAAEVILDDDRVTWRLNSLILEKLVDGLEEFIDNDSAGHFYIDGIAAPAPTLVVSINEGYD